LQTYYWGEKNEAVLRRSERRKRMKILIQNAHNEYLRVVDRKSNDSEMEEILMKSKNFLFKIGSAVVCDRAFQVILGGNKNIIHYLFISLICFCYFTL
jgi:hypothetical protein